LKAKATDKPAQLIFMSPRLPYLWHQDRPSSAGPGNLKRTLSGAIAEYLVAGDIDGDDKDAILSDFGALGLWMWNAGAWSQLSSNNPD